MLRPLGGRYGNAFSVTGVLKHEYKHPMHLTLAGGRLWRKLMSICEHKRAPVEHLILFFIFTGHLCWTVSTVSVAKRFRKCVDPCQRSLTPDETHDTHAFCVWVKSTRAPFSREWSAFTASFFPWESSALVCPFSRGNWGNHLPPAVQVQPLLRQRGDWDRGVRRWSLLTSLKER